VRSFRPTPPSSSLSSSRCSSGCTSEGSSGSTMTSGTSSPLSRRETWRSLPSHGRTGSFGVAVRRSSASSVCGRIFPVSACSAPSSRPCCSSSCFGPQSGPGCAINGVAVHPPGAGVQNIVNPFQVTHGHLRSGWPLLLADHEGRSTGATLRPDAGPSR
jgi:hypothetical protein